MRELILERQNCNCVKKRNAVKIEIEKGVIYPLFLIIRCVDYFPASGHASGTLLLGYNKNFEMYRC